MQLLQTTTQLINYKETIERQREILSVSTVFTNDEKKHLNEIYCNLIELCNSRIEARKNQNLDALNRGSL